MTALDPAARLVRIRAAVDARSARCDDDYELMLREIDRLHRRVAELEAERGGGHGRDACSPSPP